MSWENVRAAVVLVAAAMSGELLLPIVFDGTAEPASVASETTSAGPAVDIAS